MSVDLIATHKSSQKLAKLDDHFFGARACSPRVTHSLIKIELTAETADGITLAPVPANIAQKWTGFQERGRPRPLNPPVDLGNTNELGLCLHSESDPSR